MSYENVPWVLDGALTKSSLARLAEYAATGGAEGVVGIGDLKVLESATPDGNIRVSAGGALVLNRSAGGGQQTYAVSNPSYDVKAVTPSGGGGAHYLVLVRIKDPQYSPWSAPPGGEENTYQYVETFLVACGSTDKTAADAGIAYSALALARIDLPASTATVIQSYITDLRKVARPRTAEEIFHSATTVDDLLNGTVNVYEAFPNGAYMDVDVPYWATTCVVTGFIEGLRLQSAGSGKLRAAFTDGGASEATNANESAPAGGVDRRTYNIGGRIAVPSGYRNTNRRIRFEGSWSTGSGFLKTDVNTSAQMRVLFQEKSE